LWKQLDGEKFGSKAYWYWWKEKPSAEVVLVGLKWGHQRVYVWFVHSVIDSFKMILDTVEDERLSKRGRR